MSNLHSNRWSKERSLWGIRRMLVAARINTWVSPLCVIIALAWPLGYSMFEDPMVYDSEHFLSGVGKFYLQKWFVCFCTLVLAFCAIRYDLVFLINYRLRKRKWDPSDEVYEEANRAYNEVRKMNLIYLPPREFPRMSGSAHLDKVEA